MQNKEYKVLSLPYNASILQTALNRLAGESWKIEAVHPDFIIMSRTVEYLTNAE